MEVYEAALNGSFLKRDVRDMCIRTALVCFCLQSVISCAAPVIVLPDNPAKLVFPPGETQAYAADFLNGILVKAIGKKLEIVPESGSEKYPERIFIGSTDAAAQLVGELNNLKPETLIVRSKGGDLILCGEISPDGIDRGTLFAVYEYLEQALGVRWYYPDDRRIHPDGFGTIIPRSPALKLDGWNIYDWPRFHSREGGIFMTGPVSVPAKGVSVTMRGRRSTSDSGIRCCVSAVPCRPGEPTIPRSDGMRFTKIPIRNILPSAEMGKRISIRNFRTAITSARISPEFWNRCFAIWRHSIREKLLPMPGGRVPLWERRCILRSTTA